MNKKRKLQSGDVVVTIIPLNLRSFTGALGYIGVVDISETQKLGITYYASDVEMLTSKFFIPLSKIINKIFICPLFDHPNLLNDHSKISELIRITAGSVDNEKN